MKLILGSASPRRQRILQQAGYNFDILTADIDEKTIRSDDYNKLPLMIAHAKAAELIKKINDPSILITADQIVVCNNELREKPETPDEARRFLMTYKNYPAQCNNGVVIINTLSGEKYEIVENSKVYFKYFPDSVIEQIIEEGRIFDRAGGFTIDDKLLKPYIDKIDGSEESVLGFPIEPIKIILNKLGI